VFFVENDREMEEKWNPMGEMFDELSSSLPPSTLDCLHDGRLSIEERTSCLADQLNLGGELEEKFLLFYLIVNFVIFLIDSPGRFQIRFV